MVGTNPAPLLHWLFPPPDDGGFRHSSTRPKPRLARILAPLWGVTLAVGLAGSWLLVAHPLVAAAFEHWEYNDYAPSPGYAPDLYRVLRRPVIRSEEVSRSLDRIEQARRSILSLANGTRWGEDRTVKFLLYTTHYQLARQYAAVFRSEFAQLMKLEAVPLIDDPELVKTLLRLREWGCHTALVFYEPIFPRHPYDQVERILSRDRL